MASIPTPRPEQGLPQQAMASATAVPGVIESKVMVRAVLQSAVMLLVAGAGMGLLLFGGENLVEGAVAPYFVAGLCVAVAAMLLTIWLHGRFASTQMPGATSHAVSARLTGLLAAGMAVKMTLLVLGFLVLKQFPLGADPAKFSDIATFAVTFVGGSLLCQISTALTISRALSQRCTTT